MKAFLGKVGQSAGLLFAGIAQLFGLFGVVTKTAVTSVYQKKVVKASHVFRQMVVMGVDSVGIVGLVGIAVGAVLALQAAYQLKQFGALLYTGSLVALSVTRELGPLLAAIVITGRVGARMAAELGTMKVQEEVDALTTMGLNPIRYLVVPRCIAIIVVLPCLTVLADVMGMLGGFIVGTLALDINPYLYVSNSFKMLVLKDVYTGLIKSGLFAATIGLVSCYQGLAVEGGAEGVGKATTQAVVISIILIIVGDCLATAVMYYALP
jgi:phospholipid/cholesterol/gamma-HCH transport system permease protein